MLRLEIHAANSKELQAQLNDLAGTAGLACYSDEGLLSEVRQRMASKGLVVKVGPFEEPEDADGNAGGSDPVPAPKEEKAKPGRKPKAAVEAPPAAPEAPKPIEPASDTAKAMAETSNVAAPSIEDVKAALNAYAGIHGQFPAREKIKLVLPEGATPRLMDVPAAQYGKLIAALKVAA